MEQLPNVHKLIRWAYSVEVAASILKMALRNRDITIPISTMVVLDKFRSIRVEKAITSSTVPRPKDRLTTGIKNIPNSPEESPSTITRAAPHPGPGGNPRPKGMPGDSSAPTASPSRS